MKPRVKMHRMPGDIGKQEMIAMLEGRSTIRTSEQSKIYKKMVRRKERAVLKERARQTIQGEMKLTVTFDTDPKPYTKGDILETLSSGKLRPKTIKVTK